VKIDFSEISMIEIDSFYKKLLEDIALNTEDIYTLDFNDVESLSLPAIQIIISLKKYCEKSNLQLKCINITSNKIIQEIETYNIQDIFGVD
jgi:hypothetical protein